MRLIKVELHKIILRLCDKKDKMKNFTSVYDIDNLQNTIAKALKIKENSSIFKNDLAILQINDFTD